MNKDRFDGDSLEPTEGDYREGVIILIILIFVVIFELYLKSRLADSVRDKAEVSVIFLSIGLVHLLCSHLLAFLYNSRHLRLFSSFRIRERQAKPWHAKAVGIVFLSAGVVNWVL